MCSRGATYTDTQTHTDTHALLNVSPASTYRRTCCMGHRFRGAMDPFLGHQGVVQRFATCSVRTSGVAGRVDIRAQGICAGGSLPSSELKAPCVGGSGSVDDEAFLSVMADACKDAECQSPVPGPLEKATTCVFLTWLGWKLEQRVFRPLVHMRVVREASRAQHPVIAGDPATRPWLFP